MLRAWWPVLVLALIIPATTSKGTEEFRCDSEVFVGTEKKPVQASLTIFAGKLVYDFILGKEGEVTVYDLHRGTIDLLDRRRELRCTILTDDLLQVTALHKTRQAESELFKFCIQPVFDKQFENNHLTLTSPQLTYSVTCVKPQWAGAERRYAEFADWSARLNAIRPGNLPPFPRIELDEALAAHDMLPEEIERTITTRQLNLTGRRTETVRSHHLFNWTLSNADRQRIDEVGDLLIKYKSATPDDYLGLNRKTAQK